MIIEYDTNSYYFMHPDTINLITYTTSNNADAVRQRFHELLAMHIIPRKEETTLANSITVYRLPDQIKKLKDIAMDFVSKL